MLEIKWTKHAVDEVKKELKTDSEEYAQLFIKDSMRQARYISEIMDKNGKIDRLYAYRRFCFVLDRNDDVVITVYKRENVHEEIRQLVQELLFEKLADLEQTEKILEEERLAADVALQLHVELNKRIGATTATNIEEFVSWEELKAIDKKLHEFRLKKSKLAKGIAAYV